MCYLSVRNEEKKLTFKCMIHDSYILYIGLLNIKHIYLISNIRVPSPFKGPWPEK